MWMNVKWKKTCVRMGNVTTLLDHSCVVVRKGTQPSLAVVQAVQMMMSVNLAPITAT